MSQVFFSFVALPDATREDHRTYNRWHQLDHRPENLALPGVAWGDRWARPEDYKAQFPGGTPEYEDTDYVAMYWFRDPIRQSIAEWTRLGEDSFQWGRGPLLPGVCRTLLAFFNPVKGYAAPSSLVSPQVLPYRPNRGLHLTLTSYSDHHGARTHAAHAWEDRTLIPALLDVDGVAGAWTFSFAHYQQHSTLPFAGSGGAEPGSVRIRLLYLDDDPLLTTDRIVAASDDLNELGLGHPTPEAGEVLISTPLRTIIPWQDW